MNGLPVLLPAESGLPRVQFKAQPEDFVVEEVPLYAPSGSGTHTYFWIEKQNLNTLDAVRLLARCLGTRAADAGAAGLKDARAVTRQWVSFEHVPDAESRLARMDAPGLRVLQVARHGNKLKMGHLAGNRFRIRLRCATPDDAARVLNRADTALAELAVRGVPNYFGEQRFGRGRGNVELGRLLVRGDHADFASLAAQQNLDPRRIDRRLRNLFVNAFQSELFNTVLGERLPKFGVLEVGDLPMLHRNGAVFEVPSAADAEREQLRADAREISPTGPLFGPKMKQPSGAVAEREVAVLSAQGVTVADFGRKEAESQPGARRALRVFFLEPAAAKRAVNSSDVELVFALPAGSYATVVLREVMGPDFAEQE